MRPKKKPEMIPLKERVRLIESGALGFVTKHVRRFEDGWGYMVRWDNGVEGFVRLRRLERCFPNERRGRGYIRVPVLFDEKLTDLESLATALDRIIETAGLVIETDEYGPVTFLPTEVEESP